MFFGEALWETRSTSRCRNAAGSALAKSSSGLPLRCWQCQKPATQIAPELGIALNLLYKGASELQAKATDPQITFNGPGRNPLADQLEVPGASSAFRCAWSTTNARGLARLIYSTGPFGAPTSERQWVGDMTFVRTGQGHRIHQSLGYCCSSYKNGSVQLKLQVRSFPGFVGASSKLPHSKLSQPVESTLLAPDAQRVRRSLRRRESSLATGPRRWRAACERLTSRSCC